MFKSWFYHYSSVLQFTTKSTWVDKMILSAVSLGNKYQPSGNVLPLPMNIKWVAPKIYEGLILISEAITAAYFVKRSW